MKDKKGHCLAIVRFQNGSNKVAIELRVVQFWSEIILVISNRTRGRPQGERLRCPRGREAAGAKTELPPGERGCGGKDCAVPGGGDRGGKDCAAPGGGRPRGTKTALPRGYEVLHAVSISWKS